MPETIPILKLTLEGMRQTIQHAFTAYTLQLDEEVRGAIERYCSKENLHRVVTDAVNRTLDAVIKEEVHRFFNYGEGRAIVRASVEKRLADRETWTVVDLPGNEKLSDD
jgi:hypothetical protein